MEHSKIMAHIDHTQLKAFASWEDIDKLCKEAVKFQTASVCVPPAYVKRIKETYGGQLTICTVIGFPLGYNTSAAKAFEAEEAIREGAVEIDMVINIGDVKNKDYAKISAEVALLRKAAAGCILKVIIETCYLTEKEKIKMCKIVTEAGADYIKTSTGFGTAGATLEDIKLFKQHIGKDVKIKAAGGVKTVEDLEMFLDEGCVRIGTSSAISILSGKKSGDY